MTAHGHHGLRLLVQQVEAAGQSGPRQEQVPVRIHQEVELARIVGG